MTYNKNHKKICVNLDSPYKIKYEDYHEFEHSIFSSVYKQAALITREIVEKNEEYHRSPRRRGNMYRNNEQIYNILSFVGDRGSGKSSCMLSFAEYLKDYHRISQSKLSDMYKVGDSVAFIGINSIDAGLLEDKEDIVEVVLASLLGQFRKLEDEGGLIKGDDYEFRRREFNQSLQSLYASNFRRKADGLNREFASFNTLQEMSVSVNMRENIKDLIEKYIALTRHRFVDEGVKDTNCFVVIPIDDIDMNITKGYEMLEQIRRYLIVPNVIVMLSYRYKQLRDICNLYYINKMKNLTEIHGKGTSFKKKILKLSNCYMAKVVPDGRRILLPQMNDAGAFWSDALYIIPVEADGDMEKKRREAHTVDETFLRKLLRCFSIWYPTREIGMKIWKRKNLRDLCNAYNELHVLQDPENEGNPETKTVKNEIYGENYSWLLDYIDDRATLELKDEELEAFLEITDQPLEKLNQVIIETCNSLMESKRGFFSFEWTEAGEECYGTSLYFLNQLEEGKENSKISAFIKAYMSALLGKIYFSGEKDSEERLDKVFRKDLIMGIYNKKAFPHISYKLEGDDDSGLSLELGVVREIPDIPIIHDMRTEQIDMEAFRRMEIFYMFLNNIQESSLVEREGGILDIKIEKCDFGIFNFIWNLYDYEEHLQGLYNAVEANLTKANKWAKTNLEKIQENIYKKSLLDELRAWCKKYNTRYVLPVYNVELMAYILKECETLFKDVTYDIPEAEYNSGEIYMSDAISDAARMMMDKIHGLLEEQETFYENARREGDNDIISMKEIFDECPVIKHIRNTENKEDRALVPLGIIRIDKSASVKDARENVSDVSTD